MDFEKWKNQLVAHGFEADDAEVALEVLIAIDLVDRALFPQSQAVVRLAGVPGQKPGRRSNFGHKMAAYVAPTKRRPEEMYYVVVPGIAAEIGWSVNHRPLFRELRGGKAVMVGPTHIQHPCRLDVCMSIGAHEVRHRMQYHHHDRLRQFKKSRKQSRPPLLGTLVPQPLIEVIPLLVQYVDFGLIERQMRRQRRSQADIRYQLSNKEFDAYVIELLTLHRFARGMTMRGVTRVLRNLLWLGPNQGE